MKFSTSQRTLHQQNQYYPPSNYYHPNQSSNDKKIVTGSLKGPSFVEKSTFGNLARFHKYNEQISNEPGPGTYHSSVDRVAHKDDNNIKELKKKLKKGKLKDIDNSPSIPFKFYGNNVDEQQDKYIQKLLMSEDVTKSNKIVMKKSCAYTFNKSEKIPAYIPKIEEVSSRDGVILQENQIIDQVAPKQKSPFRQTNIIWRQKIQKSSDRRKQIINLINPQYTPSLELIQLISKKRQKAVPGPGTYFSKDKTQSMKGICPFSEVKRFPDNIQSILGPGFYESNLIKPNKKGFSFNRSEKKLFESQTKNNDNFRFYINPDQLRQPQPKMLTLHLSSAFGSGTTRFTSMQNHSQHHQQSNPILNKHKSSAFIQKVKIRQKKLVDDKQQGLLGISTMVSTID